MKEERMTLRKRAGIWTGLMLACALFAACTSPNRAPAPVEDRGAPRQATVAPESARNLPGAENAGKLGFHTVRPGETLIRIALESGQNWRDIARWNNLDNPNVIEVGQVLRVSPPSTTTAAADVVGRPLPPASAAMLPASAAGSAPRGSATAVVPGAAPAGSGSAEEDIAWQWPTSGTSSVLAGFDEQKNKGLDLGGRAGDPVLASADGRVVYAGAGLRGYGNLIILKHNNTYLTAYAHNQSLLVKEDQTVRKGQKIAEMGATDSDRVKLHFEIRRQGKPVDPTRYLPAR
jgi:lipoprotein NlpD